MMNVTVFATPILLIRIGQYYRSGNIEDAKHSPPDNYDASAQSDGAGTPSRTRSTTAPRTSVPARKEIAAPVIIPSTAPRSSLPMANCTVPRPPKWRAA